MWKVSSQSDSQMVCQAPVYQLSGGQSDRLSDKGEVGNTIINTKGNTVLPVVVCNKHTGVI